MLSKKRKFAIIATLIKVLPTRSSGKINAKGDVSALYEYPLYQPVALNILLAELF